MCWNITPSAEDDDCEIQSVVPLFLIFSLLHTFPKSIFNFLPSPNFDLDQGYTDENRKNFTSLLSTFFHYVTTVPVITSNNMIVCPLVSSNYRSMFKLLDSHKILRDLLLNQDPKVPMLHLSVVSLKCIF